MAKQLAEVCDLHQSNLHVLEVMWECEWSQPSPN